MPNYINPPYPEYPIRNFVPEMKSGEILVIDNNTVINDKHASFSCTLPDGDFGDAVIKIGHGRDCYAATHLEVSRTHIRVYHRYAEDMLLGEFEHGLTLSGYLTVSIDASHNYALISLATATGIYRAENVKWCGRQGQVFAWPIGIDIKNVKFSWLCDGYSKDIWLFGDSYFNTVDPSRWPYYMKRDGYTNNFMTGYPGMACERAIIDFKLSLTRGKPKIAVWCLGMNNGDKDGKINQGYLETTSEFLKLCREGGITPVISTIPSTPIIDNHIKNEWVKAQGVRYIDFASAVGGAVPTEGVLGKKYIRPSGDEGENITGYEWYPDMLYADLVHPAPLGANALYMQVLADFPEIMLK